MIGLRLSESLNEARPVRHEQTRQVIPMAAGCTLIQKPGAKTEVSG